MLQKAYFFSFWALKRCKKHRLGVLRIIYKRKTFLLSKARKPRIIRNFKKYRPNLSYDYVGEIKFDHGGSTDIANTILLQMGGIKRLIMFQDIKETHILLNIANRVNLLFQTISEYGT